MSADAVQLEATQAPDAPPRIEALHAGAVGSTLAAAAAAAAIAGAVLARGAVDARWALAIAFLALVVQQDVWRRKIPNALTGGTLLLAVALHAWQGGASAAGLSLLHAFVPFVLLILPFAMGAIGAGDVKVFMVLGALFGAGPTLVVVALTLLVAGAAAVAWLWSQGALWLLFERGFARLRGRAGDDGPARGRALQSALPLGGAIAAAFVVATAMGWIGAGPMGGMQP